MFLHLRKRLLYCSQLYIQGFCHPCFRFEVLVKHILKNIVNLLPAMRILLCIAAAVFILIGITRGEVALVLTKAVNICLECIGLG